MMKCSVINWRLTQRALICAEKIIADTARCIRSVSGRSSQRSTKKKTLSGKQGKIVPSDAQQRVIDFREGYCKVNAGAGTGKTECMTERGARMFEAGTDPHKMLLSLLRRRALRK